MFEIIENEPILFNGTLWQQIDGEPRYRAHADSTGDMVVVKNDDAVPCNAWWWMVRFTCFSPTNCLRSEATGFAESREHAMQACFDAKQLFINEISMLAAEFGAIKDAS